MIVYIDTSALVKYYVRESGTEEVERLINEAELVGFASIAYVEMASALSKAARMKWISAKDSEIVWGDFQSHWQAYSRIALSSALVERAGGLAWEHGLRGYDATHLAAALIWKETLELPVTLATFDRELWHSAKKSGLMAWPEKLV
jgi:predicted nucleic acid-binding protein